MNVESGSLHKRCPCGTGEGYDGCCGRYHADASAPTPEALMRSRFTAFALGDAAYLLRTWHPSTRPDELTPDRDLIWLGLEIVGRTGGALGSTEGTVEFRATYRDGTGRGVNAENSSFLREGGAWYYVAPA